MKKILMLLAVLFAFALIFAKAPKTQDLFNMSAAIVAKLSESPVAVEVFCLNEPAFEV